MAFIFPSVRPFSSRLRRHLLDNFWLVGWLVSWLGGVVLYHDEDTVEGARTRRANVVRTRRIYVLYIPLHYSVLVFVDVKPPGSASPWLLVGLAGRESPGAPCRGMLGS